MHREMLHGTLEVMVLKALSWGPMHGYGIGRWMEQIGGGTLRIEEGSLYPALYRMAKKGWLDWEWQVTEKNRRAKYYRLTAEGERQLRLGAAQWSDFASAVGRVMTTKQRPA